MLMPKRVKYRKMHRGNNRGMSHNGNTVAFGDFGLLAVEPAWITSRQIEAARRAISHHVKRGGKVWIRIFPDKPITLKPAETLWVAVRVQLITMWQWLNPVASCLRLVGYAPKLRWKPCTWHRPSCRLPAR